MKRILYILSALPIFASCEKELDFHYHDVAAELVIQGELTAEGATVALTLTTPMDEPTDLGRLTDADVVVDDLTDGSTAALSPGADGVYAAAVPGIVGHDYRLRVARGGKTYESTCLMRQAVEIKALEFKWIKMPYDRVAILQVSLTDDSSTDDYYWLRLFRNGEAYLWSVIDDRGAVDGVINEILMTSRKDVDEEDDNKVLVDGDVVGVEIVNISHSMLDYLVALQTDSNGHPQFDGDFCLGYFLASPVAEGEIVDHPDYMEEYK